MCLSVHTGQLVPGTKLLNIIGDIFLPVVVAVDVVGDGPGGQLVPLVGGAA